MKRLFSLLCWAAFRRTSMWFAFLLSSLSWSSMLTSQPLSSRGWGKLCRGHTISSGTPSVPASGNHVAGRECPAQLGYKVTKPQVQEGVCQMKILGSGWGPGPEAILKHLGPLHVLMTEQARHFFISLRPAMKSSLLQEMKIPPGFHKDIFSIW